MNPHVGQAEVADEVSSVRARKACLRAAIELRRNARSESQSSGFFLTNLHVPEYKTGHQLAVGPFALNQME